MIPRLFQVLKFYKDHNIRSITSGHKRCVRGWVQIDCPFCGGTYSLGCHINTGAYNCWKCRTHSQSDVVAALLKVNFHLAKEIVLQYSTRTSSQNVVKRLERQSEGLSTICSYPCGTEPMKDRHKAYLEGRKFDAEKLERQWGLMGTGPIGDYKHRIIAPISFNEKMVSYQGRDITDKSKLKYKACRQDDEVIPHQSILYGLDHIRSTAIVVEGITDVWRLGYGAACAFGMSFTMAQVNILARKLKRAYILFDNETEADILAVKLGYQLSARGVLTEVLQIDDNDPGDMVQDDADYLMKELGLR